MNRCKNFTVKNYIILPKNLSFDARSVQGPDHMSVAPGYGSHAITVSTNKKSSKKCQLGEVPVGGGANWRTKFNPWTNDFFFNFVGGKNLTPFSFLNDLK